MKKLNEFLFEVYKNNEFYQDVIKKNNISEPTVITQYPILTRNQLQQNRYNMFSKGYKAKYFSQQLHRQFSSGSSGMPINVYWDAHDYHCSMIPLWRRRKKYYNISPNDKVIKFTLMAFDLEGKSNGMYYHQTNNAALISRASLKTDQDYIEAIKFINESCPIWLYIQPYILSKLIYYYKKEKTSPPSSLRYIESVGEILSDGLHNEAESFFNVPVANMYGSEEMNGIAYECPYHHMHILTENVFVECLDDNGKVCSSGEGEAIITNLNNKTMPLVRYNQGDIIVLHDKDIHCNCGLCTPVIDVIKGRTQENITIDNIEINSYSLSELITEVNNIFNDPIIEYKFQYFTHECELVCKIKLDKTFLLWRSKIIEKTKELFEYKTCNSKNISFRVIVDELEIENKRKFAVLDII